MKSLITSAKVESKIHIIRDQSVMLDSDLANLYGVKTKVLVQAVKRNLNRFPADFLFQLNKSEANFLKSRSVPLKAHNLKSQNVTSSWGGRRSLPFAFTELGVAMLSSVLNSPRAVAVNIEIMRAFVRLRGFQFNYASVRREIEKMKKKYDASFASVFHQIKVLMQKPPNKPPFTGFHEV